MPTNPYCIHNYFASYGFADFLRGTIALYYFCKKYNYDLYIDTTTSNVFKYLKPNTKYFLHDGIEKYYKNTSFYKYNCPGMSYHDIYINLENSFKQGKSFIVSTNSMYNINAQGIPQYWGDIEDNCKEFMREILQPNTLLNNRIQDVFTNIYNMKENDQFKIIHSRSGDNFKKEDEEMCENFHRKICKYMEGDKNIEYILICDNVYIGHNLNKNIPLLKYWENMKCHSGNKKTVSEEGIINVLVDYFIMSKACELLPMGPCGSGFSLSSSLIFGSKLKRKETI